MHNVETELYGWIKTTCIYFFQLKFNTLLKATKYIQQKDIFLLTKSVKGDAISYI